MRAGYYTRASEAIRAAGGVSSIVACTVCPADARERMVDAARSFYRTTRTDRHAARAAVGLEPDRRGDRAGRRDRLHAARVVRRASRTSYLSDTRQYYAGRTV